MSDRHVIVGAGPVGTSLAGLLVAQGKEVIVVTRSGRAPVEGAEAVAADAADSERLSAICDGAQVLYNCANPKDYTTWSEVWPPLAQSMLTAAERSGALLAITGNLYPYGPVDGPMTEGLPDVATDRKGRIRATMWADALAAHRDGRIRAVEVRGSDYVGRGVGQNGHVSRVLPAAMKGKDVRVLGRADLPHSWTDVHDMARTLVAVGEQESAWGRIWHAPTNPPRSQEQAVNDVLRVAGREPVRVRPYPGAVVRAMTWVMPLMREVEELSYQRTRPYVLDSAASQQSLGLEPSPWDEVCARSADL